ncbi:hypothetical protein RHO12_03065 [Orbus sturtevantii]|uniref:NlpC/P60 family protein n=1 Tax=Orbus sturtevantii TaxID=3074109 RepID=UPI00370DC3BE
MAAKTITVEEFINKTVGLPWVNRACSFEEVDCWGLVILYYEHVLGIKLADIHGYRDKQCTIECEAIPESKRNWRQCNKKNNSVFIAYSHSVPCHVGVVIGNYALHAKGNEQTGGQVQYNRLDALERTYQKMEYYEYINLLQ